MTTIYVDSRKRVAGSDSDFEVDLGESLHLQSDSFLSTDRGRYLYWVDAALGTLNWAIMNRLEATMAQHWIHNAQPGAANCANCSDSCKLRRAKARTQNIAPLSLEGVAGNVKSPLISLGRLIKCGWKLTHSDDQICLSNGRHDIPVGRRKTEFYQRWMSPYCKSRTPFLLHVMCFVLRVLCKCPTDMSERLHVCCRAEVGGFPPFLESPMRFCN